MEHIIYKITNLLNGRFYIGMHSTENLNDGYLGSGRRIKAEIAKYGKENFKKEILEHASSRQLLEDLEAQIVNDEMLTNPLCLNLKNGGEGGGKFWSDEQRTKASIAGNLSSKRDHAAITSKAWQTRRERGTTNTGDHKGFAGKSHSEETKQKISNSRKSKSFRIEVP